MNFEGQPENNPEKERVKNIAIQFLAMLESIENQGRTVDMEADSGDKMHVPILERDEDGRYVPKWYGKTDWGTEIGPTPISNAGALKARLNNVETVKELLDDELRKEVEDGILRAGIYLSSAQ